MKYIAHRGLLDGPNSELENHPDTVNKAIAMGFDVEVDIWYVNDIWYTGHDNPTYEITKDFLYNKKLWIHCKNLEALHYLSGMNLQYFWHQNDDFVLTSNNYIWTFPGKPLTDRSIMVLPENIDSELNNIHVNCYGICSDYIKTIKERLSV